jgi:AraC-like DNA-binding protein
MADGYLADPGPAEITLFTSADIDHARSVLNRFYYPIVVGVPAGAADFGLDLRVIQLGPLTVGQLSFGGPVTLVASDLDAYHLTMPTAGRMTARHAGAEVTTGPAGAAIFGPVGGVFTSHEAHSSELDLKIERAALEAELSGLLGRPVTGPIDLPAQLDLAGGEGRSWQRMVLLLRDELDCPESLVRKPLIAGQLRHSILAGLLYAAPHRYYDELTAPAQAGPPRAIRRALDAIHDEPERPFTVIDLAETAGIGVRSLQEGFRRHLGCAPMAYLQRTRLERAHDALLAADPATVTVAAVAHRWGFAHLGRFASVYRSRFGVCPSDSLKAEG